MKSPTDCSEPGHNVPRVYSQPPAGLQQRAEIVRAPDNPPVVLVNHRHLFRVDAKVFKQKERVSLAGQRPGDLRPLPAVSPTMQLSASACSAWSCCSRRSHAGQRLDASPGRDGALSLSEPAAINSILSPGAPPIRRPSGGVRREGLDIPRRIRAAAEWPSNAAPPAIRLCGTTSSGRSSACSHGGRMLDAIVLPFITKWPFSVSDRHPVQVPVGGSSHCPPGRPHFPQRRVLGGLP